MLPRLHFVLKILFSLSLSLSLSEETMCQELKQMTSNLGKVLKEALRGMHFSFIGEN